MIICIFDKRLYILINLHNRYLNQRNVNALVTPHDYNVLIAVLTGYEDSKIDRCVLFNFKYLDARTIKPYGPKLDLTDTFIWLQINCGMWIGKTRFYITSVFSKSLTLNITSTSACPITKILTLNFLILKNIIIIKNVQFSHHIWSWSGDLHFRHLLRKLTCFVRNLSIVLTGHWLIFFTDRSSHIYFPWNLLISK